MYKLPSTPLLLLFLSFAGAIKSFMAESTQLPEVCKQIASSLAAPSAIYYAGHSNFKKLSEHWASSSDQTPACVVVPHTTTEVGKILQIIGQTRTPFAVMGGGHSTSPFLSSTEGIHISTSAFTSIEYGEDTKLVKFGSGLKWDELYSALEPHGVNVPGGRIPGVGVGGFILGGGYSFHTNQVGLSIDSVEAFELVKPNGDVVEVTHLSDPDLFFALKGGGNNFGIVTKFTMKTFPQGHIWGGTITYADPAVFASINAATARFSEEVTDPKAVLLSYLSFYQGAPILQVQIFYDAPQPPAGLFDVFLNTTSAANTVTSQSFMTMINAVTISKDLAGVRARSFGESVSAYSVKFLNVLNEELFKAGPDLTSKSVLFLAFVIEPFLPTILSHNPNDTAFPFTRDKMYTPFSVFVTWTDPTQDKAILGSIKSIRDAVVATLVEEGYEGVPTSPLYPNYTPWDSPLERIYGTNLPRLREVKGRVDPDDVMGLAGGFKVTPI